MASKKYALDDVLIQPTPVNAQFMNLTGEVFGRLSVLGYAGEKKSHKRWWVECECGAVKVVYGSSLRSGATQSCGCYHAEETAKAKTKHRMCGTPEYVSWSGAKSRCQNPNDINYQNYGGRGIEFRFGSFEEFFAEVGLKPSHEHSIDRIDSDGHYEPGNVRWATVKQQCNNTRVNRRMDIEGELKTLAEHYGSSKVREYERARNRVVDLGWCVDCAINNGPYEKCRCPRQL
ncbi:MAG: hypothetical protein AAFX06_10140 [Planctomycetota bacterium]